MRWGLSVHIIQKAGQIHISSNSALLCVAIFQFQTNSHHGRGTMSPAGSGSPHPCCPCCQRNKDRSPPESIHQMSHRDWVVPVGDVLVLNQPFWLKTVELSDWSNWGSLASYVTDKGEGRGRGEGLGAELTKTKAVKTPPTWLHTSPTHRSLPQLHL